MDWYKIYLLKKLFLKTTEWKIAWKKNTEKNYHLIENPTGYWLADPLLYSNKKDIYLFVEAFDINTNTGKLASFVFDGFNFVDFNIVLEKHYHLSYPFVFEYDNKQYMIPETSLNNCIELYQADSFPSKWKKIKKLIDGTFVDTTVWHIKDSFFKVFTYDVSKESYANGILNMKNLELDLDNLIYDKDKKMRPGGGVFVFNNKLYRPVQYNKYFYGQYLNIIDCNNHLKNKIIPQNIQIDNSCEFRRLHTYSKTDSIEVIDLSNYKFDLFKSLKKIF